MDPAMTNAQWLTILVALLVHTAALFRWGGRIDQLIRAHDRDIEHLKKADHEHANVLSVHAADILVLKKDVADLERREEGHEA